MKTKELLKLILANQELMMKAMSISKTTAAPAKKAPAKAPKKVTKKTSTKK